MVKMWILVVGAIVSIAVLIMMDGVAQKNQDDACTAWHKYECEDAHAKNYTYLYCSGFTFPYNASRDDVQPLGCAFPPWRSCEEVPYGCILR
jgi:hypothetical protein